MDKKFIRQHKKPIIAFLCLVIFLVGLFLFVDIRKEKKDTVAGDQETALPITSAGSTTAVDSIVLPVKKKKTPVRPRATLAYTEALTKYGANRMQFDEECQVVTPSVTFKNNTILMLDNRSPESRTIKIGTSSHKIASWGFALVTLSYDTLPRTIYVTCDEAQNTATLLIQK